MEKKLYSAREIRTNTSSRTLKHLAGNSILRKYMPVLRSLHVFNEYGHLVDITELLDVMYRIHYIYAEPVSQTEKFLYQIAGHDIFVDIEGSEVIVCSNCTGEILFEYDVATNTITYITSEPHPPTK